MKNISRVEKLNHICQFKLRVYSCGSNHVVHFGNKDRRDFETTTFNEDAIEPGCLVAMSAAGFSKYYLSWVIDKKTENGFAHYLLESIEDGDRAWWYNIDLRVMPRTFTDQYPEWRWTDEQWEINARIQKGVKKKRDVYIWKLLKCEFNEKGEVAIRIRRIFSDEVRVDEFFKVNKRTTQKFFAEQYYAVCESVGGSFVNRT